MMHSFMSPTCSWLYDYASYTCAQTAQMCPCRIALLGVKSAAVLQTSVEFIISRRILFLPFACKTMRCYGRKATVRIIIERPVICDLAIARVVL